MLCVIQLLEGNCPISYWRVGGRESPSPPPGLHLPEGASLHHNLPQNPFISLASGRPQGKKVYWYYFVCYWLSRFSFDPMQCIAMVPLLQWFWTTCATFDRQDCELHWVWGKWGTLRCHKSPTLVLGLQACLDVELSSQLTKCIQMKSFYIF